MMRQKLLFQPRRRPIPPTRPATGPTWARHAACVVRSLATQTQPLTAQARPSVPFLHAPSSSTSAVRYFTSTRRRWIRHEFWLAARYTLVFWGVLGAGFVIFFFGREEYLEHVHPTPHEWTFLTRMYLRTARDLQDPRDGRVAWCDALAYARNAVLRLDNPQQDGGRGAVKLTDDADPALLYPFEFDAYDVSPRSDDWRRGYFDALMTAARAAEHVDGWVLDVTRDMVSPARYVIGPSNPMPEPIPAGYSHPPLEENCVDAFPSADRWYIKILATRGFTPRQRLEAALEFASFMEYKNQPDAARSLHQLALAEATRDADGDPARLPYHADTLVLRGDAAAPPPSLNVIDVLTAIANSKARAGDLAAALPMYVSLLKARRGLPNEPPREQKQQQPASGSLLQRAMDIFKPPAYPAPPTDGTRPPWRSPEERCQEASLQIYIGEILYSTSSPDDGLAWTRDGVDLAEEQLRSLDGRAATTAAAAAAPDAKETKKRCRECLATGLENWRTMVSTLAEAEQARSEKSAANSKPGFFSFGGSRAKDPEGRWAAEVAVVQERIRRTRDIMEDLAAPKDFLTNWFKA